MAELIPHTSILLTAIILHALVKSEQRRGTIIGGATRVLEEAHKASVRRKIKRYLDEYRVIEGVVFVLEFGRHATRWALDFAS